MLAVIAVGGGLGSLARYGAGQWIEDRPRGFPLATFLVNVSGCLLLGVLMVFVADVWRPGRYARPFVGIGLLGGFTTYSTMMLDVRGLGAGAEWATAALYLVASVLLGLVGVWVAMMGTRAVTGIPVRRRARHDSVSEEVG